MHVIPVNVAAVMQFDFDELSQNLSGKHPLCDFLIQRWYNHMDGGRSRRTLWDLAIIYALIYPERVVEVKIKTSKENGNKEVFYYKTIDAEFFNQEFFQTMLKFEDIKAK